VLALTCLPAFADGQVGSGKQRPSAAWQGPALLPTAPIEESFQPRTEVGAPGVRVGLIAATPTGFVDPNQIFVFLPKSQLQLCVEISSVDGRYFATATFHPGNASGETLLRLDTRFAKELTEYKTSDMAILAALRVSCADSTRALVVASWRRGANPRNAQLLVNTSQMRASLTLPSEPWSNNQNSCVAVPSPSVTFNKSCAIAIPDSSRDWTLQLRRWQNPRVRLPPVHVPIWLP
jgi:hypothetical protein